MTPLPALILTHEDAVRIERPENDAWLDMYAAMPDTFRREFGADIVDIDGVLVTRCKALPFVHFNAALSLGLHAPATEQALDDVMDAYRRLDIRRFTVLHHEHCRPPELPQWLVMRGFEPRAGFRLARSGDAVFNIRLKEAPKDLLRAEIMDSIHVGGVGGTYAGNPLCCVAAIEALDEVLDPDFQARSVRLGDLLRARLDEIARRIPQVGEVRGLGAMLAIELVEDPGTKEPAAALTARTVELARERGLLLMGAGIYSNVIRFLVPLVASDDDVLEGMEILEGALRDAAA